MAKTVFNYETARWLEIHNKHRAASSTKQNVSDQKMQQLQEMFSSLDNDGGGEIEIGELQIAMSFLGLDQEQPVYTVLEYTGSRIAACQRCGQRPPNLHC